MRKKTDYTDLRNDYADFNRRKHPLIGVIRYSFFIACFIWCCLFSLQAQDMGEVYPADKAAAKPATEAVAPVVKEAPKPDAEGVPPADLESAKPVAEAASPAAKEASPAAKEAPQAAAEAVPSTDEAKGAEATAEEETLQPVVEAVPLASEEMPQPASEVLGMQGKISLDLRNIDVIDALRFLAEKAGVNVVTTKAVTGRVMLKVDNVLVQDVFDVMLRANGLAYEKRENIYNVMTETEYKELYGKTFSDVREVKVFDLVYAIPEQVFNLCDTLKSEIGRVLVSPESGKVVLMDSPERIGIIQKAIETFEKENMVKVFDINYANAKDVADQLKSQLEAKKVGFVRADERNNQVIVQTLPERMDQVAELIKSLDTKTKEVLIEAKVVRVSLDKSTTDSVEWEGLFEAIRNEEGLTYVGSTPFASVQGASDPWRSRKTVLEGGMSPDGTEIHGADNVGSYPFSATTSAFNTSSPRTGLEQMHIGIVGAHDVDVTLRKFQDIGKTEILGTPRITVTNNQEAKLHVGEKQAYVTSTTTTGQTTSTVSEEITFIDVGLQFFVTPTINVDGYIVLKLKTEISSVVDTLITPTKNRIPILGTNRAETTVMTKDGTTVIIGGLRQITTTNTETRTPVLAAIPFLGQMFRSRQPTYNRSEVLILITPHITSGDILVGGVGSGGQAIVKPAKAYGKQKEAEKISEASLTARESIKGFKTGK